MAGARGSGGAVPRPFTKMSGAGNDFLVFGSRVGVGPIEAETIRRLCRRGTGVGADGVLFVTASSPGRVTAAYYNADGGEARFCANGTRCAARFAALRLEASSILDVETGWGAVGAKVHADGRVTLRLPAPVGPTSPAPTFDPHEQLLERSGAAVSVGVPHLVVFTSGRTPVDELDLPALAPRLRFHPALPEGANVHFVEAEGRSRLKLRSWERGVEGETLSCGSGAVAHSPDPLGRGARRRLQAGGRCRHGRDLDGRRPDHLRGDMERGAPVRISPR